MHDRQRDAVASATATETEEEAGEAEEVMVNTSFTPATVEALRTARAEIQTQIANLEAQRDAIDRLVDGTPATPAAPVSTAKRPILQPAPPPSDDPAGKVASSDSLRELVLRIITKSVKAMRLGEIVAAVQAAGWKPPGISPVNKCVMNALQSLKRAEEIELEDGAWVVSR